MKFESTVSALVSSYSAHSSEGNHTEHLVGLTEAESHLILVHELAILLGTFGPHFES